MAQSPNGTIRSLGIVSAIHNVNRYLGDFFASLEAQTYGIDNLEIVLVDDGSTDESLATCTEFARRWPGSVRVFSQANAGQGSARNLGLDHATAEWVTFTDPDDTLDPNYFDEVARAINSPEFAATHIVSTAIIMHDERTGAFDDRHPLKAKFAQSGRVFDLTVDSDFIQMSAATAFFRRALIGAQRFDTAIRPTFEDGAFIARYLLAIDRPTLGAVGTARYHYRKRADRSSTLETSGADEAKYRTVPRAGFLAVLTEAAARHGRVPVWLQNMIVYELVWYLRADSAVESKTGTLSAEGAAEFHGLVREILGLIETSTIEVFTVLPMSDDIRFALLHGFSDTAARPTIVEFTEADVEQRLVRLSYRFTGNKPAEQVFVDGVATPPAHAKYRTIDFYQRRIGRERIVWVPAGDRVRIELDGVRMPIARPGTPASDVIERDGPLQWNLPKPDRRPAALQLHTESRWMRMIAGLRRRLSKPALFETALSIALHSGVVRRRYVGAWVFMDRDVDAADSAEQLYRYVSREQRQVRSYFVLRRDSSDWARLRRERFRLIPYGSWRWQLLMLGAAHVASTHADLYAIRPLAPRRFGQPQWRFTFLQHGIIKDDLSRWLNSKRIHLFLTSTEAEYHHLVDDDSPYVFTSKEVVLTGLPRFDSLVAKRNAVPPAERRLILVAPTWRLGLVGDAHTTETARTSAEDFAESRFATAWSAFLGSAALAQVAREHGLEVVFMPHPKMEPYLDSFTAPAGVRVVGYASHDIQSLLAQSRLLVTDYSSVAFNAAVIDVPTVYFQFDRDDFYSGAHPTRAGYFDYDADGFGPVTTDLAGAEVAVRDVLGDSALLVEYSRRAASAIAFHDTRNSERVFEAMNRLTSPWPH